MFPIVKYFEFFKKLWPSFYFNSVSLGAICHFIKNLTSPCTPSIYIYIYIYGERNHFLYLISDKNIWQYLPSTLNEYPSHLKIGNEVPPSQNHRTTLFCFFPLLGIAVNTLNCCSFLLVDFGTSNKKVKRTVRKQFFVKHN